MDLEGTDSRERGQVLSIALLFYPCFSDDIVPIFYHVCNL